MMRSMETEAACQQAADWLAGGQAQATCLWDAVHLAAGELMMRQPGIYGIHTVTSVNGLRYAFEQAASVQSAALHDPAPLPLAPPRTASTPHTFAAIIVQSADISATPSFASTVSSTHNFSHHA